MIKMVFEQNQRSIFENRDNIGINIVRQDVSAMIEENEVQVKLIRHNENKGLQGDFFGSETPTYSNTEELIYINIISQNPEGAMLKQDGFSGRGEITYDCFGNYNLNISNKDEIEFLEDTGDIKAGEKYKIELKDFGLLKGNYTYKMFTITKT